MEWWCNDDHDDDDDDDDDDDEAGAGAGAGAGGRNPCVQLRWPTSINDTPLGSKNGRARPPLNDSNKYMDQ